MAAAIGEAIERYCAAVVPRNALEKAKYRDIECNALNPECLTLYDEAQYADPTFKFHRFHADLPLSWVPAYSLTNKRPILVPASAVYLPYHPYQGEQRFFQGTTTGLACGNTLEEAILSGLCEVVERDSTMLMWHGCLSLPHLEISAQSPSSVLDALDRFERSNIEIHLIDVSTDLEIPAVVAVASSRNKLPPAYVFASCARPNMEGATIGALEELAQCVVWVRSLLRDRPLPQFRSDLTDVRSRQDHVLWPALPDARASLTFVTASPNASNIEQLPCASASDDVLSDINKCVKSLEQRGYETIIVDITSDDIREVGLHVVRILVPGTQPLYFGYHRLNHVRLQRLFDRYGSSDIGRARINPLPHPFP